MSTNRTGTQSIHPFRIILFITASYLGWQATRNCALFALIVATITCWNIDDIYNKPNPFRHYVSLIIIGLFALSIISGCLYAWGREGRSIGMGERRQAFAHEACSFLARPGMPERIIAFNISQAAVCIPYVSPAHKLFLDPRLEVNSQDTAEHYLKGIRGLLLGDPNWGSVLGINYKIPAEIPAILIERSFLRRGIRTLAADSRWRCVFADDTAVVFVYAPAAEKLGLAKITQ